MIRHRLAYVTAASLMLALGGCGGYAPMAMTGGAGVTTGGAQDIGQARNLVAAGRIPAPESFVVEGLLSEYDIPVTSAPCQQRLCLDTAVAVAPAIDTGREEAFMVVGMSTNVDLRRFERKPLDLAVVVDRSGSMGGGKMEAARAALHQLVSGLRPDDRLALVAFDHEVDVLLPPVVLREGTESLHEIIDEIEARGSTNIEAALQTGYELVAGSRRAGREARVMLITDARPNVGRTSKSSFIGLANAYGERGIGLTVFGVGLDFGQELTLAISRTPGANYVYLENAAKLRKVFDRDIDLLVTPVAWDVEMVVQPDPGYRIVAAYGVPSSVDTEGAGVRVHLPTLFLSRNRGAIVFRLAATGRPTGSHGPHGRAGHEGLGRAWIGYREVQEGQAFRDEEVVEVQREAQVGVLRAVSLVNAALGLKEASRAARAGDAANALALLAEVDRQLATDQALEPTRKLGQQLSRLIGEQLPAERRRDEAEYGARRGPQWIR